jgi:hypothetical protein
MERYREACLGLIESESKSKNIEPSTAASNAHRRTCADVIDNNGTKESRGKTGDNGYPASSRIVFSSLLTYPLCSTLTNEGTHVPRIIHHVGAFVRLLLIATLPLPPLRSARNGHAD